MTSQMGVRGIKNVLSVELWYIFIYNQWYVILWQDILKNMLHTPSNLYCSREGRIKTTKERYVIEKKFHIDPANYSSWKFIEKTGHGQVWQKQRQIHSLDKKLWYNKSPWILEFLNKLRLNAVAEYYNETEGMVISGII